MFNSVPFSLCKYDTIMKTTTTVYFSWYPFVYNIQVKTFLKISWKKCVLWLYSNATFAAKWLKIFIILQLLQLFFQNQAFLQLLQVSAPTPLFCQKWKLRAQVIYYWSTSIFFKNWVFSELNSHFNHFWLHPFRFCS